MSLYPEDVPFDIIRESWCSYDLGNDITLKSKLVLLKILKPADVRMDDARRFIFQTAKPLVIVTCPNERKGAPMTQELTNELLNNSVTHDIDPIPIDTSVNEYRLENDAIIRLRLMFTRVAMTDLFSADGSPLVSASSQVVPQVILPAPTRARTGSLNPIV